MRKVRTMSLRSRMLILSLSLLTAFALLLVGYSVVMVRSMTERMLLETEEPLQSYMGEFHDRNEILEEYLSYLVVTNSTFKQLSDLEEKTELYLESNALQSDLSALVGVSGGEYSIVLYHARLDFMIAVPNIIQQNDEQQLVTERQQRSILQEELKKGEYPLDRWFCVEAEDEILYVRAARYNNIVCCCVYPLSKLVENVAGESGSVVLYYADEPLFGVQPPAELPMQKNQAVLLGGISGYLVAQASEDELTLARFDMENSRFANMLPNVLIVLAVVVLLILALGLLYLWQGFYLPVARLADTMTELEQGTFDAERLNHVYSGAEFRQMNSSLKKLLSQITDLKIKTYEKELERRDAQLQYLRAQIRPHFYLNCLKNLYAMAQVSTPEKMQESILYLSKHMRYIFSDHAQEEPLSKELELCQNYVALFGSMNIDYKITCDVEIAPAVRDVPIPPVTILSLVENSVKYSIRQSRTLKIFITATRLELEEGALLNISVKDNGEGFSREWLETFNRLEADPDASQHVGMANLVRRCREIYGDQFHIAFYNGHKTDDYCGACIDLFWPLNGGAGQDEAADRG